MKNDLVYHCLWRIERNHLFLKNNNEFNHDVLHFSIKERKDKWLKTELGDSQHCHIQKLQNTTQAKEVSLKKSKNSLKKTNQFLGKDSSILGKLTKNVPFPMLGMIMHEKP